MPTGTPFYSIISPYNIRVDDFAPSVSERLKPSLHLLTHTHTDHINGLSSKSFSWPVICSQDAKEMLLRHEVFAERALYDNEYRAEKSRTFSHLKVDPAVQPDGSVHYNGARDLLRPIPLNTPTKYQLSDEEFITITAFDANHCPGAVMYLLEGSKGAVLHTGDFRAESWFLESLVHNQFLQPYLVPPGTATSPGNGTGIVKTLEAIYLDTACLLSPNNVPTKQQATTGLIELITMYAPSCYFFINSWTWGYEDILKEIARAFDSQIHVDRYKFSVYTRLSDPLLRDIVTRDENSTRFHACERFERCEQVAVEEVPVGSQRYHNSTSKMGKRVIYINPVTMSVENWALYLSDTKQRLVSGQEINHLLVPLSRHSPLPELRSFVALFRPRRVVPNTLDPELHNLDWIAMNSMLSGCLHDRIPPYPSLLPDSTTSPMSGNEVNNEGDVALKNLIGEGAAEIAGRWTENGKIRKKLEFLRGYLPARERSLVNQWLGIEDATPLCDHPNDDVQISNRLWKGKGKALLDESDHDSDCDGSEDERGKTAHKLFSGTANNGDKENQWWYSSSPVQSQTFADQPEPTLHDRRLNKTPRQLLSPRSSPTHRKAPLPPLVLSPLRPANCSNLFGDKAAETDGAFTYVPSDSSPRPLRITPASQHCSDLLSGQMRGGVTARPSLARSSVLASPVVGNETALATPERLKFAHADLPQLPPNERGNEPEPDFIYISSSSPCPSPRSHHKPTKDSSQNRVYASASKVSLGKRPQSPQTSGTNVDGVVRSRKRKREQNKGNTGDQNATMVPSPHAQLGQNLPTSFETHPAQPERQTPAKGLVVKSGKSLSPRRHAKHKRKAERYAIADRLAKARPDLTAPTYHAKQERRTAKLCREATREQYRAGLRSFAEIPIEGEQSSFKTVHSKEADDRVDWERSRVLEEELRQKVARGERVELPRLICAESLEHSEE